MLKVFQKSKHLNLEANCLKASVYKTSYVGRLQRPWALYLIRMRLTRPLLGKQFLHSVGLNELSTNSRRQYIYGLCEKVYAQSSCVYTPCLAPII